jgi:hypothetical protein
MTFEPKHHVLQTPFEQKQTELCPQFRRARLQNSRQQSISSSKG